MPKNLLRDLYHKVWSKIDIISKNSHKNDCESIFTNNLKYGSNPENKFDIFLPENIDQRAPAVILIHGGGYISGNRLTTRTLCKQFADMGFVAFNFEYTKSDSMEAKYFPTPIYEFFEFYKYISTQTQFSKLIDFNNIYLFGDSSGAHIATLIANIQTNDNLKFDFNLQGGPKIKGLILNCPSFGIYKFMGLFPKTQFQEVVFGDSISRDPLCEITHNLDVMTNRLPPILMFSVKGDFVVGVHKKMFLKKARELNLSVEHYTISSGYHLFHSCLINNSRRYPKCIEKMKNFITEGCKNNFVSNVCTERIYEDSEESDNLIQF